MTLDAIVAEAIAADKGESVEYYHEVDAAAVLVRLAPLLQAAHWAAHHDVVMFGESNIPPDLLAALIDHIAETGSAAETIRERAVREVDTEHGYTMEFASSPEAHAAEYDERERDLLAALNQWADEQ